VFFGSWKAFGHGAEASSWPSTTTE
jgi:hypothetical protein